MGGLFSGLGETDPDAVPLPVVAVVEVGTIPPAQLASLRNPNVNAMTVRHKYGRSAVLSEAGGITKVIVATHDGKPYPTVHDRYLREFRRAYEKDKPSVEQQLALAEFALTHGLVVEFGKVMDKLAQDENGKNLPSVVAYLKVKADLDKPTAKDETSEELRRKLLEGYKVTAGKHYTVLHNGATDAPVEIKSRLDRLEQNFRIFYYWFALRGHALSVPTERLVVVVTHKDAEFTRYHEVLSSGPEVADGFFAQRENLTVFAGQRRDAPYDALLKFTQPMWQEFERRDILKGNGAGIPRSKQDTKEIWQAQTMALLLRVMEDDAELASVSHDATRQLVYASGLLPRGVVAPEWVQFGMGSFFETPAGSPWMSPASPSYRYLPVFKELHKGKKLESSDADTLRKVITNVYFRHAERVKTESAKQKAQSTAWALTYYLAQRRLDGLLRFYQELAKMPRDLELSDEVLIGAFARAFDCVDANKKVDASKLAKLAEQWVLYVKGTKLEAEEIYNEITKNQAEMRTQPPQGEGNRPGRGGAAGPAGPGRGGPGGPGPGGS
jgi:hypothetical protein